MKKTPSFFALVTCLFVATQASSQGWGPTPQEEAKVVSVLGLAPGKVVGEIGAGDGHLSLVAARAVAPGGRVFATELGDSKRETLKRNAEADPEVRNIEFVEARIKTTGLAASCCDDVRREPRCKRFIVSLVQVEYCAVTVHEGLFFAVMHIRVSRRKVGVRLNEETVDISGNAVPDSDGLTRFGCLREFALERPQLGRTPHFAEVQLDHPLEEGSFVNARICGHDGKRLTGKVVK